MWDNTTKVSHNLQKEQLPEEGHVPSPVYESIKEDLKQYVSQNTKMQALAVTKKCEMETEETNHLKIIASHFR